MNQDLYLKYLNNAHTYCTNVKMSTISSNSKFEDKRQWTLCTWRRAVTC